jgi:hypothetical protein
MPTRSSLLNLSYFLRRIRLKIDALARRKIGKNDLHKYCAVLAAEFPFALVDIELG